MDVMTDCADSVAWAAEHGDSDVSLLFSARHGKCMRLVPWPPHSSLPPLAMIRGGHDGVVTNLVMDA